MWDSEGETADLAHIEKAFGFLANSDRYYEVEQEGSIVLTVKDHRCLGCNADASLDSDGYCADCNEENEDESTAN